MTSKLSIVFGLVLAIGIFVPVNMAQTTGFTYQGSLNSSGVVANGNHDFEFALFDAVSGGAQLGSTITQSSVAVTNGIFAVSLDFGSQFPGAGRFLEIRVRPTGGGAFTPLAPRQPITSAPYAVKSLNSDTATTATNATNATNATTAVSFSGSLSGDVTGTQSATAIATGAVTTPKLADNSVTNAKIVDVAGSKITGLITTATIAGANVTGAVANATNAVNATTAIDATNATTATNALNLGGVAANQYVVTTDPRMTDQRVPTAGSLNYVQNTVFQQAGSSFNISGTGRADIFDATTDYRIGGSRILSNAGSENLFAGAGTGGNAAGSQNAFFGANAGANNQSGSFNSFFGRSAGINNQTGANNSFFGTSAGSLTFSGGNSFFGAASGAFNQAGNNNTIIGSFANVGPSNLTNANAIGHRALVAQSNSLVLGSINGQNGATADTNVGIGTTAPTAKLTVAGNGVFSSSSAARFDLFNSTANLGYLQNVTDAGLWQMATTTGSTLMVVNSSGDVGIGTASPNRKLEVNGRARIGSIPLEASFAQVCFSGAGDLLQCGASSLRWKTNVQAFSDGLNILRHLRPISYNWKDGGAYDIGLGAEDVAKVDPSFVFTNSKGEVEGVKYERLNLLLINAVKEQQVQIEEQKKVIVRQDGRIDALTRLVCASNRDADICKEK